MKKMSERLAELQRSTKVGPPGVAVEPNIVVDDDSLEVHLGDPTSGRPTPASVMGLVGTASPIPEDACPAVVSVLTRKEDWHSLDIVLGRTRLSAAEFWQRMCKEDRFVRNCRNGIRLAIAGDRPGAETEAATLWDLLGQTYRVEALFLAADGRHPQAWDGSYEAIRRALDEHAKDFWSRPPQSPARKSMYGALVDPRRLDPEHEPACESDHELSSFETCLPILARLAAKKHLRDGTRTSIATVAMLEVLAGPDHPMLPMVLNVASVSASRTIGDEPTLWASRRAVDIAQRSFQENDYRLCRYRTNLAVSLFKAGATREARELLETVLQVEEPWPNALYWYAQVLRRESDATSRVGEIDTLRKYLPLDQKSASRRLEAERRLRALKVKRYLVPADMGTRATPGQSAHSPSTDRNSSWHRGQYAETPASTAAGGSSKRPVSTPLAFANRRSDRFK